MRRGHSGTGGWRNENPRHYRSRNCGNSHFRPSRNYGLLDLPRFPPPSSRSIGPQFNSHPENHDQGSADHGDRNRYRNNRHKRNDYQRPHQHGDRQILPLLQQARHSSDNHRNTFPVDGLHINSLGDVDHRQIPPLRNSYRQPFVDPWSSQNNIQHPIERPHVKPHGPDGDVSKLEPHYTGHRPPASDHYGCNPTHSFSTFDNSHSFSRSVNDTVDIVRRRLLNRNEPSIMNSTENYDNSQNNTNLEQQMLAERVDYTPNSQQDQPTKKRFQRQKHNEKSATIKNKIVHQLFKMDKEKLHKLMDNPNSSHKFEYAINSLITESQNSFNRHLRSTAEKSLCSTSAEFMQNDNNTIYEDTFLKQMQCILDPQDTVFLEDIKPIVMAELTKVLQLDEFEQKFSNSEDDNSYAQDNQSSYNQYTNNEYIYEDYGQNCSHNMSQTDYVRPKSADNISSHNPYEDKTIYKDRKPLFERRQRSKSYNYHGEMNTSPEKVLYHRPSVDNDPIDEGTRLQTPLPYFDTNTEQLSEEEDPFAELDQQYHVAVDHDFIENDDISIPSQIKEESNINLINSKAEIKMEPKSPDKNSRTIIEEIDSQIQDMAKSPLKLSYIKDHSCLPQEGKENNIQSIKDLNPNCNISKQEKDKINICCTNEEKNNKSKSQSQDMTKENEKIDNIATALKSTSSNSRKRSIEQRPSHRKEKKKKVEMCQAESGNQILNKNIIINVNDCASKVTEKCEAPKSIFNLFFSKEEGKSVSKDNKKISANDKNFTEKHVKRKETPKKSNDTKKRKDSTTNQTTCPPDSTEILSKSEAKTALKTIDMFTEQPKKIINVHQAHRNTAPTKIDEHGTKSGESKISPIKTIKAHKPFSRQLIKSHVAVQVTRKLPVKQTQTEKKKFATKAVQTDFVPDKPHTSSSDAFERMKEIDLEIQVLLQEKFKLYNSIESKECGSNSIESKESGTNTLGMTLLNVNEFDEEDNEVAEHILTEDAIVADFANIPVEELEQIAFESVEQIETPKPELKSRHRKTSRQDSIQSYCSTTVGKRKTKKPKSPNISLIEQIVTDDIPLEDIISLDDLELLETKTKSKPVKKQPAKKKANVRTKRAKNSTPDVKIKECSVVLIRYDINQYLNKQQTEQISQEIDAMHEIVEKNDEENMHNEVVITTESGTINIIQHEDTVFEESVVNDIQIDMLDVSEDIVVGDNCEVKCLEDKVVENVPVPISEEIILDNSQSFIEEVTAALNQGDECKVYDYSADENLRRDSVVVSGNGDAVLAIECVETNFLAACLDGNVYYFSNEGQLITTLRGSNLAVTCVTIVKEKHGTTVYTGSLDSRIRYYDLETGLEKGPECNVLSPIQTMDRAWDTVFVGTRTGFVLQFECKNNMLIPVSSVKFSDQSILALRAMKEGPRKVLLVAARSENVTIKDAQTGLLLRTLAGPKMTVYTLLYEDGKVYCGTSSHQIHVFDYTSGSHVGTHEGGKGAVCLRATGGLLFAGCYDGCVYVYREGEGQPFAQIRGPSLMLLSLAVVGSKIIAGYKDRSLYIWKIPLCILKEMIL